MSRTPTLHAAITGTLELALNSALELDPPGRREFLRALDGQVCLEVSEPVALSVCLQKTRQGVQVSGVRPENPALTITGKPLALAALALGDEDVLNNGRLSVEGDFERAQQFRRAVIQLDPDWEAALARYTGDIPAHFIGRQVRAGVRWSRDALQSLSASMEEYIHEETRTLPGQRELDATFRDIDQLSLRAEQLGERIDQLETGAEPDPNHSTPESS